MPKLLDAADLDRALADLPGAARDRSGAIALSVTAPSFADAVRLVDAVAVQADALDHHPDVDLRWRTVTFTFSTHSAGGVTELDVELARRVLATAGETGAVTLDPPQRVEIALDCVDADAVRPFWAAGLGYAGHRTGDQATAADDDGFGTELHDPAGRGPVLWFQHLDPPRAGRGRFHLDVYLTLPECRARLDACLAAGGRLVSDAHAPSWWVLADPEGNELCLCTREPDPA